MKPSTTCMIVTYFAHWCSTNYQIFALLQLQNEYYFVYFYFFFLRR